MIDDRSRGCANLEAGVMSTSALTYASSHCFLWTDSMYSGLEESIDREEVEAKAGLMPSPSSETEGFALVGASSSTSTLSSATRTKGKIDHETAVFEASPEMLLSDT